LVEAPPFDRAAYLVGVVDGTGEYAGLVRIWRNPSGPRLGLVGVRRPYRSTPLAAALLKQGLAAASRWGHEAFTTETSLSNRAIYPRLTRLGAESLGRSHQLVLSPPGTGG
jgi:GNAT superfamily N-acetyltransferase